jgi:adenylate cyclase
MTQEGFKRKLTAILSADVEGYSRLMNDDEEATIQTLTAYRSTITATVQQYRGRVVDSPGDNILSEFTSVVDAVNCAVDIQRELVERNTELPEKRQMRFRIGVNLGDVVEDEGRIYGDGVNIAARVEKLAEAGGISISGTVFEHIKDKLSLGYHYLGEQDVKNIPEPVKVYRLLTEPEAAGKVIGQKISAGKNKRSLLSFTATALAIIVCGIVFWQLYTINSKKVEAASVDAMAYPLPDDPSIVVLPFENLNEDSDQLYLSDGITNQIITVLTQLPGVFVIASQSASIYRGEPVNAKQVSEDLGVRYVLNGSIQKSDNRLRVTAQLIDAVGGRILWSKRYDNEMKEIFALQDEIVLKIIHSLALKWPGEKLRRGDSYARIGTSSLEAYLKTMQSGYHFKRFNRENNPIARKLAEEALQIDPNYALANNLIGWTHIADVWIGLSKDPKESMSQAFQFAQKAIAMKDNIPSAHGVLSHIYTYQGQHDLAIEEAEKAVAIAPSYKSAYSWLGDALYYAGRPEDALAMFEKALRLNPYPDAYQFYDLGRAYIMAGRYEDAVIALEKSISIDTDFFPGYFYITCVYALLNRGDEANNAVKNVIRLNPKFSLKVWTKKKGYIKRTVLEKMVDCLRKAGLPE